MALSNQEVVDIMTKQIVGAAVIRLEGRGRDTSDANIREEVKTLFSIILVSGLRELDNESRY